MCIRDSSIDGVIIDPTPATVGASMVTLSELVTEDVQTQRIVIAQDGTTRWDLKAEEGFVGPFVTDFQTHKSEEGGTGSGKWHYSFDIFYKKTGNLSAGGESVYELHNSVSVTQKNGEVIRKIWKAEARSTSSDSAISAIKSFKPSEEFITFETEQFFHDNKATGVWIWDMANGANGIKFWSCKVTYRGGKGWVDSPTAGANSNPVFYKKQLGKGVIEVVGTIISSKIDITAPALHFAESESVFHATEDERVQKGPEIYGDPRNGEYKLDYHEMWYCVGTPPSPNHSGRHDLIGNESPPGTGSMVTS